MRKLLIGLATSLALCGSAIAQVHDTQSFITGWSPPADGGKGSGQQVALLFTNSVAGFVPYGVTNQYYYALANTINPGYGVNVTLATNALLNPVLWQTQFTNGTQAGTNVYFIQYITGSNYPPGSATSGSAGSGAYNDCKNYADGNGNYNQSLAIQCTIVGDIAACNNYVTNVYARVNQFGYYDTNNVFKLLIGPEQGTNPVTVVSNLPTWFSAGANAFRWIYTQCGTNSSTSTNTYVIGNYLVGFKPPSRQ